ncbi:MAG: AraC family transcriptional regulator [Opitutaceae bacterium]|nr:AraC family transcriptional regulator [Opitutaceae bacterium]
MPSPAPVEKIVWSQPPDMLDIDVISGRNSDRHWRVYHQTYTICSIIEHGGLTEWSYRGKEYTSYRKQLTLMEPGEIHQTSKHTAQIDFHVLQIAPSLMEQLTQDSVYRGLPHFKTGQASRPSLFHAFAQFHLALAVCAPLLERQSRLADCVRALLVDCAERELRAEPTPPRSALRRARDYLHEHYAEKIALQNVADIAGLSQFHFLRAFSREFGLPPHAYQNSLRVEKTRLLLKAGVPVQAIEAGFADQSHLIRHFKRMIGVTPGEYVAMMGGKRTTSAPRRQQ